MPLSPYQTKLARLNSEINNQIIGAFLDAQNELGALSAPPTTYLELQWDGSFIQRAWDTNKVVNLDLSEQNRLLSQLDGLFKKAVYALNLP